MCFPVLGRFSLGMLFMLHILWFMMDLGGCRFDVDNRIHVVSASASTAPSCAVVALFSVVGASCCALAMVRSFLVAAAFWSVFRQIWVLVPLSVWSQTRLGACRMCTLGS